MPRASELGLSPVEHPEHWERYYAQVAAPEDMPWFWPGLDPDVERALDEHGLAGGRALDLGTGPANHAFELARRGFAVTGSDLSPSAVARAAAGARELGLDARFVHDDVLATRLAGPFDVIVDRGCFHCLAPAARGVYAANVAGLLAPAGLFLLKTFSYEDPGTEGPHRLHPDELDRVFAAHLERLALVHTVYQNTLEDQPKALLTTWRRRA